jgi:hypothetical protein
MPNVKGGKTKAWYTTQAADRESPHRHFNVQKWTPDLEIEGPPYRVQILESGGGGSDIWICNCPARVSPCRHVKMVLKFLEEGKIGTHSYYDYDHARFYQPSSTLLEGFN